MYIYACKSKNVSCYEYNKYVIHVCVKPWICECFKLRCTKYELNQKFQNNIQNYKCIMTLIKNLKIIKTKSQCLLHCICHQTKDELWINRKINHNWAIMKMAKKCPNVVLMLKTFSGCQPWMDSSRCLCFGNSISNMSFRNLSWRSTPTILGTRANTLVMLVVGIFWARPPSTTTLDTRAKTLVATTIGLSQTRPPSLKTLTWKPSTHHLHLQEQLNHQNQHQYDLQHKPYAQNKKNRNNLEFKKKKPK